MGFYRQTPGHRQMAAHMLNLACAGNSQPTANKSAVISFRRPASGTARALRNSISVVPLNPFLLKDPSRV